MARQRRRWIGATPASQRETDDAGDGEQPDERGAEAAKGNAQNEAGRDNATPVQDEAERTANAEHLDHHEAARQWLRTPGVDARRRPTPCESALPVGAGTDPGRGCQRHDDAAGCVLTSFGDALVTARTDPFAVRARLHEISHTLPVHKWAIYATARDPFAFLDRAMATIDIATDDVPRLTIRSLSHDATHFTLGHRTITIPEHVRPVIAAHRDIRVTEGSAADRPLLIPTDDRCRSLRRSPPTHRGQASRPANDSDSRS